MKLSCPGCKRSLHVPDSQAGRQVRCPQCKAAVHVPGTPPVPDPAPLAESRSSGVPATYDEPLAALAQAAGQRREPIPPKPHETARPAPAVPSYWAMEMIGRLLQVLGVAIWLLGLVLAGLDLAGKFEVFATDRERIQAAAGLLLVMFVLGLYNMGLGQAILAFRDMARNSWIK